MPLKLAGSVRSPCFGMGMMTLLVHSCGAVPVSNARFMMLSSWAEAIPVMKCNERCITKQSSILLAPF